MIIDYIDDNGLVRVTLKASQFKTDEHNNLCIFVNNLCTQVYAAGTWQYVEVEPNG